MGVVLLLIVAAAPASGQEPAPSDAPPAPAPTPVLTPTLEPVPVQVIPPVQPFPPSTVPSAPQRLLPGPGAGIPLTATLQFQPTLTLSEEYSDNFDLTERNKRSNFRSSVSPGLRLFVNSAFTKGVIAYTFTPAHDSATDEIRYFHSLLGQVSWEVHPRWKLTAADTLTRSDHPGEADSLGLRRERRTFTNNTFSLSSDYLIGTVATRQSYLMTIFSDDAGAETTSHTLAATATLPIYQTNSVSLGYDYLNSTSSRGSDTVGAQFISGGQIVSVGQGTGSRESTTTGHQVSAAVSRQLSNVRSIGLRTSYAFRTVSDDAGDTDYRLWNVSAFTNYSLPGRFSINSSLGLTGLTTESGASQGPNFFSTTGITYNFARAVASLTVNQGFSETFSEGQDFGVVDTLGITGSLSYPFTPLLSGTASGFYRRTKTTGVGNADGGGGGDEQDESWGGTLTFSLRLLAKLGLGLTYSYLRQNGTGGDQIVVGTGRQVGSGTGYTENRVRASLSLSF